MCFFNGSLYGVLVELSKRNGVKSIVFYHNIEANYYKARYLLKKDLFSIVFYWYVKKNELLSTLNADVRIVLNERDGKELKKVYAKDFDLILPISMPLQNVKKTKSAENRYCLFVGSNFFANQYGCIWFIEKVVPHISFPVYFVGTICDFLKQKYTSIPNVYYLGFVDDLDAVYDSASFIISPIFSGSGMKTKTIEALSYGKYILGTSEAFVGIEADYEELGGLCNDNTSFINKINTWDKTSNFNTYSYNLFLNNYTDEVVEEKLKNCLYSL